MPHDKNGSELKKGDKVTLTAEVTNVTESENACNVSLQIEGPENEYKPTMTCNSKLCEKVGDTDTAKAARQGYENAMAGKQ